MGLVARGCGDCAVAGDPTGWTWRDLGRCFGVRCVGCGFLHAAIDVGWSRNMDWIADEGDVGETPCILIVRCDFWNRVVGLALRRFGIGYRYRRSLQAVGGNHCSRYLRWTIAYGYERLYHVRYGGHPIETGISAIVHRAVRIIGAHQRTADPSVRMVLSGSNGAMVSTRDFRMDILGKLDHGSGNPYRRHACAGKPRMECCTIVHFALYGARSFDTRIPGPEEKSGSDGNEDIPPLFPIGHVAGCECDSVGGAAVVRCIGDVGQV